ncbi:MAG: aldehyde ferredoxin oxidoreductase family protein [Moorellales bacterium]
MPLNRKVAIIDLTTENIEIKPIPLEMRRKYIGGRALDAYLLYNHMKPGVDPLGPDNVLVVSGGLLTGCLASGVSRTHVCAKSPLTGGFGSCNGGGFFSAELAYAGFHHLVIKGKAKKPVYLYVHNGKIEIRDASKVWGTTVHDCQKLIRKELGDEEVKVLCIGQGGENLVRFANVMTGLKNSGGRTGMGAVMGSKNLKAIAARGTMDIKIAHPMEALEFNKRFIQLITSAKVNQTMGKIGTGFIWGATNSWGGVRVRNFQLNQLEDCETVEAEYLDEISAKTIGPHHMSACFGCQVHCRPRYRIPEGWPYAGEYDEGPEYTSQGAFAGEPGIPIGEVVLVANHMVNMWGLDTLETGSLISWAMELYEKGILTLEDTGGLDLRFGNYEALFEMIRRIAFREGLGDILAEGGRRAAAKIGKGSEKYLIDVKGMQNLHSDERATPGLALNIAVSSRGSDHLRGRPAIDLYKLPEPVLRKIYSTPIPYNGPLSSDYRDYEGKAWQVVWHEHCYMGVDSVGICKYHTTFLGATLPNFPDWAKAIYYNTGLEMTPEEIWYVAERGYNLERLFNLREGWTEKDDWLSDRYFDEPLPLGAPGIKGRKLDREKFRQIRAEYYQHRGWDENGVPTPETLKRLGLDNEPSHIL